MDRSRSRLNHMQFRVDAEGRFSCSGPCNMRSKSPLAKSPLAKSPLAKSLLEMPLLEANA